MPRWTDYAILTALALLVAAVLWAIRVIQTHSEATTCRVLVIDGITCVKCGISPHETATCKWGTQ